MRKNEKLHTKKKRSEDKTFICLSNFSILTAVCCLLIVRTLSTDQQQQRIREMQSTFFSFSENEETSAFVKIRKISYFPSSPTKARSLSQIQLFPLASPALSSAVFLSVVTAAAALHWCALALWSCLSLLSHFFSVAERERASHHSQREREEKGKAKLSAIARLGKIIHEAWRTGETS